MTHDEIIDCILEDIRIANPLKGDPKEWSQSAINNFLNEMRLDVKQKLMDNADLCRNMGLAPNVEKEIYTWAGISLSTFRRNFLKRSHSTNPATLNKFAIYLGYNSGEDYKNKRVKSGVEQSDIAIEPHSEKESASSSAPIPASSAPPKKSSKRLLFSLGVGALFILAAFLLVDKSDETTPERATLFAQDSTFNVLILPFYKLVETSEQEYHIHVAIHERMEQIRLKQKAEARPIDIVRIDSISKFLLVEEALELGTKAGADLVIYGDYEAYGIEEDQKINMKYVLTDETFHLVSRALHGGEEMSSSARNTITNLRNGTLTGSVEDVVHACFAQLSFIDREYIDCLDHFSKFTLEPKIEQVALYWLKAQAFYLTRNYSDAYDSMIIACELDSLDYKKHNNLGTYSRSLGEYERAEVHLKRAIELNPTYQRSIMNLGNVYFSMHEYEKALECYTLAAELNPSDSFVIVNRAELNHILGHHDAALEDYLHYINTSPKDPYGHVYIAKLYIDMERPLDAIASLKIAESLDPTDPEVYSLMSTAYMNDANVNKAQFYQAKSDSLTNR